MENRKSNFTIYFYGILFYIFLLVVLEVDVVLISLYVVLITLAVLIHTLIRFFNN